MTEFLAMQTGQTAWQQEDRLEPPSGAPLLDEAAEEIRRVARELSDRTLGAAYAAAGEAEQATAALAAKALGVKVRIRKGLGELDYGLWQGLTLEEIRRRQPKVYRKWTADPSSVRPPEGETVEDARSRLSRTVRDILRRHKKGRALLVLRPTMMGLLGCIAEGDPDEQLWAHVRSAEQWETYDIDFNHD